MQRLIGILPDRPDGAPAPVFDDVREQVQALLGIQVEHMNWFSPYKVQHRVAAQFRERCCFIVGDAAHLHSPVGSQGMNAGLGDAVNLDWKLAQKLQGQSNDALLDTYESERIVFARKLVATTDRAFQAVVAQAIAAQFLRRWRLPHALPFLSGFGRARRLLLRTVHCYTFNIAATLAGLGRDAAYLVRPDGHIALALHYQESGALRALALRLGLHFGPAESDKTALRRV